jgi:hypothetical protein
MAPRLQSLAEDSPKSLSTGLTKCGFRSTDQTCGLVSQVDAWESEKNRFDLIHLLIKIP